MYASEYKCVRAILNLLIIKYIMLNKSLVKIFLLIFYNF